VVWPTRAVRAPRARAGALRRHQPVDKYRL